VLVSIQHILLLIKLLSSQETLMMTVNTDGNPLLEELSQLPEMLTIQIKSQEEPKSSVT
jgi:hypothetical protein